MAQESRHKAQSRSRATAERSSDRFWWLALSLRVVGRGDVFLPFPAAEDTLSAGSELWKLYVMENLRIH